MDQRESDQVTGFFLPVPPSYQLPDRAFGAPIGTTENFEFHPVSPEDESSNQQVLRTLDTLDESNSIPEFFPVSPAYRGFRLAASVVPEEPDTDNIPEFFPTSPVHRSFCSGASPIPAQQEETDNIAEFFPVSPVQSSQSETIRAIPSSAQQDETDGIPEFFPVSPENRGSLSGASTIPDGHADNIPRFLPVSLQREGFHSGALRAPVGFAEQPNQPRVYNRLLACMHNSSGDCSWENCIRRIQPQLREMYTKFHAIRQAQDLDFCFTGIPFRYRHHAGQRCKTLINAMLFVQCARNWLLIKDQTGISIGTRGRTHEQLMSCNCPTHGSRSHLMGAIAAITGREKWTYYVNKNAPSNKVPRRLRPSASHSCDNGLLCNDMYCLDMEPLGPNKMRQYNCFGAALATYDSGKPISKFCSFPEHSEHPCNLWRVIEHHRHSMSMIIKEFAFFSQKKPEQLTSIEIGPFFQLTHNGVPFPHLGMDDLDFSYITWDHSKTNIPQRPRICSIQRPMSTGRPEELASFLGSRGRGQAQVWNGLNRFIDDSSTI